MSSFTCPTYFTSMVTSMVFCTVCALYCTVDPREVVNSVCRYLSVTCAPWVRSGIGFGLNLLGVVRVGSVSVRRSLAITFRVRRRGQSTRNVDARQSPGPRYAQSVAVRYNVLLRPRLSSRLVHTRHAPASELRALSHSLGYIPNRC